jgi:hypothetical protein
MKSYREIWELFYDHTFVGNVLRYSTLLEFELNALIAQYFIRSDRYEYAMEELLPELTFGKKIDILTHLPVRKSLSSYQQAISGLRRFQKIRNIVAHNPSVSLSKAKLFSNDGNFKQMLQEYPTGMQQEYRQTLRALSRLLKIREFRNAQSNKAIDSQTISLRNWLS